MIENKWYKCEVELAAGINESTTITTIFQAFGEDEERYYDVEGSGYMKDLCKIYR